MRTFPRPWGDHAPKSALAAPKMTPGDVVLTTLHGDTWLATPGSPETFQPPATNASHQL
jgi:hypothetical protein